MLTAKPGGSRHSTWKENGIAHEIAPTMKESGDPDAKEDDDDSGLGYSDNYTDCYNDGSSYGSYAYNEYESQGEALGNDD